MIWYNKKKFNPPKTDHYADLCYDDIIKVVRYVYHINWIETLKTFFDITKIGFCVYDGIWEASKENSYFTHWGFTDKLEKTQHGNTI